MLFRENVFGTRLFLARLREARIPRLVHVSSFSVYGCPRYSGELIDERHPIDSMPHARDTYAYSKIEQELVVRRFSETSQTSVAIIRPGVIYGPGRDAITGRVGLRIGRFLMAMNSRRLMPYTHVTNCADAVYLAGALGDAQGKVFNVIDDELPTPRSLLMHRRRYIRDLTAFPVSNWATRTLTTTYEWYHRLVEWADPANFDLP